MKLLQPVVPSFQSPSEIKTIPIIVLPWTLFQAADLSDCNARPTLALRFLGWRHTWIFQKFIRHLSCVAHRLHNDIQFFAQIGPRLRISQRADCFGPRDRLLSCVPINDDIPRFHTPCIIPEDRERWF